MNVNEAAHALTRRGYFVVPLVPGEKKAADKGWQNLRIKDEEIDERWPIEGTMNVGMLTGLQCRPGWYVIGLDVDETDPQIAAELMRNIECAFDFPPPAKRGKKGGTYFVRLPHAIKKGYIRRKDEVTGKFVNVIEVLAEGQQTVMPPSIHPDTGEPYHWLNGQSLWDMDPESLPVYDQCAISEIALAVQKPGSPVFALNTMQWLGEEGGGDVHNSVVPAVAALVALQWADDAIWDRVNRATRRAVEAFGDLYEWPGWEEKVRKMIADAREKGFAEKPRKEKIVKFVARWFLDSFTGKEKIYNRDGQLTLYKEGAFDRMTREDIRHLIATRYIEPEGVSLVSSDWKAVSDTIMDMADRFPKHQILRRVCLRNGTFDMETGELRDWSPSDFLISRLDFHFDQRTDCPTYDKFMDDTFANLPPGDKETSIALFEEYIAHTLFEYTEFHKFLVIKGQPRTGKSTLIAICKMLHGEKAVSAVPVHEFGNERYRTSMVGKLVNLITEVASTSHAADDFLKAVTAGDPVQVRYLYEEPMLVKLPTRLIIACNDMFRTRDNSGAIEARMLVLSCDNVVPEKDRDTKLIHKLAGERSAILIKLQKAWERLRERGYFIPPSTSTIELKKFTMENNHVQAWILDRCVQGQILEDPENYKVDPELVTETGQLYLDYVDWAKLNGFKQISSITFGMRLTSLRIPGLMLDSVTKRVGGRVVRCRNLTLLNSRSY